MTLWGSTLLLVTNPGALDSLPYDDGAIAGYDPKVMPARESLAIAMHMWIRLRSATRRQHYNKEQFELSSAYAPCWPESQLVATKTVALRTGAQHRARL